MKFDKARNLVKLLFVMSIVLAIVGIVLNNSGAQSLVISILAILCFVMAFAVVFAYCRCPHCGKVIYLGLFKETYCPYCKRNFETGVKKKGKR